MAQCQYVLAHNFVHYFRSSSRAGDGKKRQSEPAWQLACTRFDSGQRDQASPTSMHRPSTGGACRPAANDSQKEVSRKGAKAQRNEADQDFTPGHSRFADPHGIGAFSPAVVAQRRSHSPRSGGGALPWVKPTEPFANRRTSRVAATWIGQTECRRCAAWGVVRLLSGGLRRSGYMISPLRG